ncbi:hypothetical protein [Rhizobium sp. 18065]|uniref:hypothetical protein n=1 Tax=Rhizobium sp. 18065 TaxID=2681411 RepID=UPI001359C4D2|nr:hypothetical protein [Rhizobium sp. 18065]
MGKLLAVGLWVCIVTLGAVYGAISLATAPAGPSEEDHKAPLELVKGEPITIPVISDGGVSGYFLTRVSFMMDKAKITGVELPMTELMTDELFTLLIGNKMVDLANTKGFDVAVFREKIKTDINAHLGEGFVSQVLIEQLDYVSKEVARKAADGDSRGPLDATVIVEGEKVEEPAAGSGH